MILTTNNKKIIDFGIKGENLAKTITIDFSDWKETYGNGELRVFIQRNGEDVAYPAEITIQNSKASLPITSKETAIAGFGLMEIYYVVDTQIVKSVIWKTMVQPSLGETNPQSPYEDILLVLDEKIEQVEKAAEKIVNLEVEGIQGDETSVEKIETEDEIKLIFTLQKGERGERGERGLTGPTGPQGIQGVPGSQGVPGVPGEQGPAGEPFAIYKTYETVAAMNADADNVPEGKFVMIVSTVETEDNAKLYVKGESAFSFIVDLSGMRGIQGPAGPQGNPGEQGIPGTPGSQGVQGNPGVDGITFTPEVSDSGVISWSNDGGAENPESVDLVEAVLNALDVAEGGEY